MIFSYLLYVRIGEKDSRIITIQLILHYLQWFILNNLILVCCHVIKIWQ